MKNFAPRIMSAVSVTNIMYGQDWTNVTNTVCKPNIWFPKPNMSSIIVLLFRCFQMLEKLLFSLLIQCMLKNFSEIFWDSSWHDPRNWVWPIYRQIWMNLKILYFFPDTIFLLREGVQRFFSVRKQESLFLIATVFIEYLKFPNNLKLQDSWAMRQC